MPRDAPDRLFLVGWSDGQTVGWSDGRMVGWVGWSDGRMVEWSDGRMVKHGPLVGRSAVFVSSLKPIQTIHSINSINSVKSIRSTQHSTKQAMKNNQIKSNQTTHLNHRPFYAPQDYMTSDKIMWQHESSLLYTTEQHNKALQQEIPRDAPDKLILVGWSDGRTVGWSDGRMVGWLDGRTVGRSDGGTVKWSDG